MLGVVYQDTLDQASHFCHLIKLFFIFPCFWSDLRAAIWRPSGAPFSSNYICIESSGCLVSNSPNRARFWATVVEIARLEGRWCSAKNSVTFFLKKFVSSNLWQISSNPFYERYSRPYSSSCFIQTTPVLVQLIQFLVCSKLLDLA